MKFRIFVLALISAVSGLAQDRGTIRGVVTDATGATVPDATVTIKNVNTGLTQTVKTSADGVYSVLYLPAGDYTVTTEKAGFRKAETIERTLDAELYFYSRVFGFDLADPVEPVDIANLP